MGDCNQPRRFFVAVFCVNSTIPTRLGMEPKNKTRGVMAFSRPPDGTEPQGFSK
jgi:hypothetical protein